MAGRGRGAARSRVSDYSIFHDPETNILFATLVRRPDHKMNELPKHPAVRRWWDFMHTMMSTHPDNKPIAKPLDDVSHMK